MNDIHFFEFLGRLMIFLTQFETLTDAERVALCDAAVEACRLLLRGGTMDHNFDFAAEQKSLFSDALEASSLTPTECAELLDLADAAFEAVRSAAFDEGYAAGRDQAGHCGDSSFDDIMEGRGYFATF